VAGGDYVGPVVTADAVCVRVDGGTLEVLTLTRERAPFKGRRALPGVYVNRGETIEAATDRCLRDKVGVDATKAEYRRIVDVYDNLTRDPRGHCLSIVTMVVLAAAEPRLGESAWAPIVEVEGLAFDHDDIVGATHANVRERLWHDQALLAGLLGDSPLTTGALVDVVEAVEGAPANISNVRRKISTCGFFVATGETAAPVGRGRPSTTWAWAY
jgi:8-oxo-dGTP diphosphatase